MTIIRFHEYRLYEEQRVAVNDAMMGLLAGSKIAVQTLSLMTGSKAHLAEVLPSVPHVSRFNLKVDRAAEVLEHAEPYLAAICIPHVFASHEAFMKDAALRMCLDAGLISNGKYKNARMENMHETHAAVADGSEEPVRDTLALFHALRGARNAIIHANSKLTEARHLDALNDLNQDGMTLWTRLTKQPYPVFESHGPLNPSLEMLIATLAIAKRLAEWSNAVLQVALSDADWRRVASADWSINGSPVGNPAQIARREAGFVRQHYPVLREKPGT